MVPFFVVDRPISLEIIKGIRLPKGKVIGLMAHANTSANFRKAFREFPHEQVIKMCDSAIFNLGGYKNDHTELFEVYEEMGVEYGVIIDVLGDGPATVESAKKALEAYDPEKHHFKLVAVAQGKTVKQYLDCYEQLRNLGYTYIAIGGLLQKRERTARYTNVRNEKLMCEVLRQISEKFDPDWQFALGCFHTSRMSLFKELNVWGDYKGWIFEYKKRDETIKESIEQLRTNHIRHASRSFQSSLLCAEITKLLNKRRRAWVERNKVHKNLLKAKKAFRVSFAAAYEVIRKKHRKLARTLVHFKSRGLLDGSDRALLERALWEAGITKGMIRKIIKSLDTSHQQKTFLLKAQKRLDNCNRQLLTLLKTLKQSRSANRELKRLALEICKVLRASEQSHRISQVRTYIENNIIATL